MEYSATEIASTSDVIGTLLATRVQCGAISGTTSGTSTVTDGVGDAFWG